VHVDEVKYVNRSELAHVAEEELSALVLACKEVCQTLVGCKCVAVLDASCQQLLWCTGAHDTVDHLHYRRLVVSFSADLVTTWLVHRALERCVSGNSVESRRLTPWRSSVEVSAVFWLRKVPSLLDQLVCSLCPLHDATVVFGPVSKQCGDKPFHLCLGEEDVFLTEDLLLVVADW
jgi:hypothetical protein